MTDEDEPQPAAWLRRLPLVALVAATFASAFGFLARGVDAQLWDDALFFKRVAYNVVRHGFAGWNQQDGPIFINTSQLYQLITVAFEALVPGYFDAAVVLWSAACLAATGCMLWTLARREHPALPPAGALFVFVALQAPPLFLALHTGMETCTVYLTLALVLWLTCAPGARRRPLLLGALNALVYLARPDATLLSALLGLILLCEPGPARARRLAIYAISTAALLGLIGTMCKMYYGTSVPLAAFLKLAPVSVYDAAYLARGRGDKLRNLLLMALVLAPLAPLLTLRRDRLNLALLAAALAFIGFHALTTFEVMGYHARFYAPALPLVVYAALRGLAAAPSPRRALALVAVGGAVELLALAAYRLTWIENGVSGFTLNQVPLRDYLVYFSGLPLVGALLVLRRRQATAVAAAAAALLSLLATAALALAWLPRAPRLARDLAVYEHSIVDDLPLVGLDVVRRCFPEPLQLVHSELGIPGVLFLESRIIDYTGLANPNVARGRFDFERLCGDDRPEVIFRPHWSHRRLNQQLDASACLAERYTQVVDASARSSSPLYVRNDLVARYRACSTH